MRCILVVRTHQFNEEFISHEMVHDQVYLFIYVCGNRAGLEVLQFIKPDLVLIEVQGDMADSIILSDLMRAQQRVDDVPILFLDKESVHTQVVPLQQKPGRFCLAASCSLPQLLAAVEQLCEA